MTSDPSTQQPSNSAEPVEIPDTDDAVDQVESDQSPSEADEADEADLATDADDEFDAGEPDAADFEDDPEVRPTPRRRHTLAGGALAAAMMGMDQLLGRKVKEDAPIVIAASDEPMDIDEEGISVAVSDDLIVIAPPQPRTEPPARNQRRSRAKTRR